MAALYWRARTEIASIDNCGHHFAPASVTRKLQLSVIDCFMKALRENIESSSKATHKKLTVDLLEKWQGPDDRTRLVHKAIVCLPACLPVCMYVCTYACM